MNVAALGMTGEELGKRLIDEQSLWLNAGEMYGDDHFIRWNIACPRTRLAEALGRFEKFVKKHT